MTDDLETIALRPNVVDGARQEDDYEVMWRGLPIGRMMKLPNGQHWWWGCNVYGQPSTPNDRGPAINFKDCQVRFRLAWGRIRPTLTEEAILAAMQHAEGLRQQQLATEAKPSAPEPVHILQNNRAAPRQRVLKAGSIEFAGGVIDCTVRNLSESGAALEVASPLGIPETFNLLVSGEPSPRRCRVAWRKDTRIGIAFL